MKITPPTYNALKPAALAAGLLVAVLPAGAQMLFNGNNSVMFEQATWSEGFRVGFGQDQDGQLDLVGSDITSDPEVWLAHSEDTGSQNTAVLNIDGTSRLNLSSGSVAHFGYDGDATINVADGGLLETRQAVLGVLPGSSGTINLSGWSAQWQHRVWYVDVGRAGTGEVNVLNGARIGGAQRFIIGGTIITPASEPVAGGTGTLTVDGFGSEINFGNSSIAGTGLQVGRRGTGTATVSNGGVINVTGSGNPQSIWVGNQPGGAGTLNILTGGVVNTDGIFRISTSSSDSSITTVDGTGSQLNIDQWAFVGNTGTEGTVGTLNILNGGAVNITSSLRTGNLSGATGIVNVNGTGSKLDLGTYLQLGVNDEATGTANVTNGGTIDVANYLHVGAAGVGFLNILDGGTVNTAFRPETAYGTFIGRFATGNGTLEVAGSGSALNATHFLFLGADPDGEATGGVGRLIVRDGGSVTAGTTFRARGESAIELDGGSIAAAGGFFFQDNSSLTGEGMLNGNLEIEAGTTFQGSGVGIQVTGTLSGTGTVQNARLRTLHSVASVGPLTLENVGFSCTQPSAVNIVVDDLDAENLISFDLGTAFVCAALTVSFADIDPSGKASFTLFDFTGPGDPAYDFVSVTVPEGWFFEDGVLHNENVVPGSAFAEWAASYGLSGDAAEPGADPDGDGFSNEQEFAFGTDPTVPTASLVQISLDGNNLTLRWNRSEDAGIQYIIEQTTNLANWEPVVGATPVAMETPDATPPAGYERVEWTVDISGEGTRSFYRVSAEVDPSLLP